MYSRKNGVFLFATVSILPSKPVKKYKDDTTKLIEAKLNSIFCKEFSLINLLSNKYIVNVSPALPYETIKQFEERLKSAGLSVTAKEPLILINGTMVHPARLDLEGPSETILEKLNLMVTEDRSLNSSRVLSK